MSDLKYLVYVVQDDTLTDIMAAFKYREDAEKYVEEKRKEKQYAVKKEYYIKEQEEDVE